MCKERYKIDLPTFRTLHRYNYRFITNNVIQVLCEDKISLRKSLYKIACYFRREFSYDFVQYSIKEKDDIKTNAYIFYDELYPSYNLVFGGFVFRYRDEWNNIDPHWALQWIWIHPYERSKGHLRKIWPHLENKFGNFIVEGPISRAMKFFLRRNKCYQRHTDLYQYNYKKT